MMRIALILGLMLCGISATSVAPAVAQPSCGGDCDTDGRVTVDEILLSVAAALDPEAADCTAADLDGDGHVTIDEIVVIVGNALIGCSVDVTAAPSLVTAEPAAHALEVSRSARIRLEFATPIDPGALPTFRLSCDGGEHPLRVSSAGSNELLLDPAGLLPVNQECVLLWRGPDGGAWLAFRTTEIDGEAEVIYDRIAGRSIHPYPDDFFLVDDDSKPNGVRLAVPLPLATSDVQGIFRVLTRETPKYDGFSPIGHFVVEFAEAPGPDSLPLSPADSLVPSANAGLFDLTVGSPTYGTRIPFRADIRDDLSVIGVRSHSMLVFPSIPLEPGGRYGFVLSNRARTLSGRPIVPSPFLAQALAPARDGEHPSVTRVRELANEVVEAVTEAEGLSADDVALAMRITVRTTDDIPKDLLAIREQVSAAAPPAFTIDSVEAHANPDIAAIVRGTWQAPNWRNDLHFVRDDEGIPVRTGTSEIPFILALPAAAADGPVPITMYQHGNPGSAQREVPNEAADYLAGAGFAVIGFTDNLNREVSPGITDTVEAITQQVVSIFFGLIRFQRIPDFWVQLNGEQLAFVRMLETLDSIDVLPLGAPDGIPDLDVAAPLTYVGISQGANYAPGLLAYAPEIKAAAVMVGGARLVEVLIHQQAEAFLTQLGMVFPNMTPADIWVGMALFQAIYDVQDHHNHARFLYRHPLEIDGTTRKASVLLVEGLNDSLVPNHATESLAWAMGPIPHLLPVQRAVPFLDSIVGPVTSNIDAETTAAFFQFVPVGIEGIDPTPGCAVLTPRSATEGHYCAQGAEESERQRAEFFLSALGEGPPTIINPFE